MELMAHGRGAKKCKKKCKAKYSDSEDEDEDEKEYAERVNIKARLFKEEGKSKEYCETHYYNKVYKNTNDKNLINPNNFFADLAQFWSNEKTNKNIGFKTENILINPKNFTEAIFILSVLDLEPKTLSNAYVKRA